MAIQGVKTEWLRLSPFPKERPRLEQGMLVLPEAPGLGLVLDQAAVKRFRVDR